MFIFSIPECFLSVSMIFVYSIVDQSEHEKTISVLLNGVESTVEFLDGIDIQVYN